MTRAIMFKLSSAMVTHFINGQLKLALQILRDIEDEIIMELDKQESK